MYEFEKALKEIAVDRRGEFEKVRRWKEALWMGFSMKEVSEHMGVGLRTLRKLKRGEGYRGLYGVEYAHVPWPDGSIGGMPEWKVKEMRSWNARRAHMCNNRVKSGGYKL